ncbi:hypothetical protein BPOR_0047g00140 [Botrytis porri]|uniref:Uncharacterized protein n=1 Tax=Botrytis porri TaxID=87229 RepID=A0A4Z1L289_9HELO|nr:hypothetical protein BPOR_0047g00140 [Botrytis porri]
MTWHAEGFITKTQDTFHKSSLFKYCWQRAQEECYIESAEGNAKLEQIEDHLTRTPDSIDGIKKKSRHEITVADTIMVDTSDRQDVGEDWICINTYKFLGVDQRVSPDTQANHVNLRIVPDLVAGQRTILLTPSGEDDPTINDSTLDDELLYTQSHNDNSSKDEAPLPSNATIMPEEFETPIIYPALPQTPPSQMTLDPENDSSLRTSPKLALENKASTSPKKSHKIPVTIEVERKLTLSLQEEAINTMLQRFRSIATILSLERDMWVMMPAQPLLDDCNFIIWYSQRFGFNNPQRLRFHFMDSFLNPSSVPVDIGVSDGESTRLKQDTFFDFLKTYNYCNGNLQKYRILVVPENLVGLANSRRSYPFSNKEALFEFYQEDERELFSSSDAGSLNTKSQSQIRSYRKEQQLKSKARSTKPLLVEPLSHSSRSIPSEAIERGIRLPPLQPPIEFPPSKLPPLGQIDTGNSLSRYQLPGDPVIVVRVQKIDGRFSVPLHNAPFGPNVKIQEFFTWFVRFASHPSAVSPKLLQIWLRDAIPAVQYEIQQGDEQRFTHIKRNILPQCRRTVAMMSPISEFVILIRAPNWNVAVT